MSGMRTVVVDKIASVTSSLRSVARASPSQRKIPLRRRLWSVVAEILNNQVHLQHAGTDKRGAWPRCRRGDIVVGRAWDTAKALFGYSGPHTRDAEAGRM